MSYVSCCINATSGRKKRENNLKVQDKNRKKSCYSCRKCPSQAAKLIAYEQDRRKKVNPEP